MATVLELVSAPEAEDEDLAEARAHVEQVVRGALALVVSADSHDLVLGVALEHAHGDHLPAGGPSLRNFLSGPLHTALESFFAAELAQAVVEEVLEELTPLFDGPDEGAARSGVRSGVKSTPLPTVLVLGTPLGDVGKRVTLPVQNPLSPFSRSTIPATRPERTTVYLVTTDGELHGQLSSSLGEHVSLVMRSDGPSMVERLRRDEPVAPVILIDCRSRVGASTLACIAPALPSNADVVLWGAPSNISEQRSHVANPQDRWVSASEELRPKEVALMLQLMVGRAPG